MGVDGRIAVNGTLSDGCELMLQILLMTADTQQLCCMVGLAALRTDRLAS